MHEREPRKPAEQFPFLEGQKDFRYVFFEIMDMYNKNLLDGVDPWDLVWDMVEIRDEELAKRLTPAKTKIVFNAIKNDAPRIAEKIIKETYINPWATDEDGKSLVELANKKGMQSLVRLLKDIQRGEKLEFLRKKKREREAPAIEYESVQELEKRIPTTPPLEFTPEGKLDVLKELTVEEKMELEKKRRRRENGT